jgi:hypothetical protein
VKDHLAFIRGPDTQMLGVLIQPVLLWACCGSGLSNLTELRRRRNQINPGVAACFLPSLDQPTPVEIEAVCHISDNLNFPA